VRKPSRFEIETSLGLLNAGALVVATGGLSFPKLGATDFGHRLAEQFGLKLIPPRPGLVPLTFGPEDLTTFAGLSGISLDVIARGNGASFRENLLFTHRGLSGPAILQVSNYATETIHVDLLPDEPGTRLLDAHRRDNKDVRSLLGLRLPQRFAQSWCGRFAPARPVSQLSARELQEVAARLHDWEIRPAGNEGYAKAEVTLGGVDTNELSSKTMESRRVPGLYFIGEVVDVTGWLGGYNFQWAWASGFAAGQAV
jgi:hypothetical protein